MAETWMTSIQAGSGGINIEVYFPLLPCFEIVFKDFPLAKTYILKKLGGLSQESRGPILVLLILISMW